MGWKDRNGQLTAVTVATLEGQTKRIEADVLLPFFGLFDVAGPDRRLGPGAGA